MSVKVCPSIHPLDVPYLADRKPRKIVSLVMAKISASTYIPSLTKSKQ